MNTNEARKMNTESELKTKNEACPLDAIVNRPIVFRAWNKNWKEMEHEVYDVTPSEDYVFMQYTGFNDMIGDPIYEGDIIESSYPDEVSENGFCIVRNLVGFAMGGFCWQGENSYEWYPLVEGEADEVKIVGNIYENPELLE
jgi:uncharacterized phage protein (TIGR01671 family)